MPRWSFFLNQKFNIEVFILKNKTVDIILYIVYQYLTGHALNENGIITYIFYVHICTSYLHIKDKKDSLSMGYNIEYLEIFRKLFLLFLIVVL